MKSFFLPTWGVFFMGALTLSACQGKADKENAQSIELYIRYLQDSKILRAEAIFYTRKDTSVYFRSMENVRFQGQPMQKRDLGQLGIRYLSEFSAPASTNIFLFEYGPKNQPLKYQPTLPGIRQYGVASPISKKRGCTINLDADPFGENERLRLLFTDSLGRTANIEIPNLVGKKDLNLPAEALISLFPGKNTMEMIRKRVFETTLEDGSILNLNTEFYTTNISVIVE